MLNFGASKPRVKGGPVPRGPPLDPRLSWLSFSLLTSYYEVGISRFCGVLNGDRFSKKIAAEGRRTDFLFLVPESQLLDPLLCCIKVQRGTQGRKRGSYYRPKTNFWAR